MNISPLVSIIIPTYNRAALLKKALASARKQTYPNTEIIVVNDGSTDNTDEVLAPYMDDIIYIKQENQGLPTTKNVGLSRASGEFIAILDDDDLFLPEKIERQVEKFRKNPDIGICATDAYYIDADDKIIGTYTTPTMTRQTQVLKLLRRCILVQSSVMVHRKCHDKLGTYKPILSSDYDFFLRVAPYYKISVVKEPRTMYRRHGNQLTSEKYWDTLLKECKEIILDFIEETPIERIVPFGSKEEGHAILGLILCEHKYFEQAEQQFLKALPSYSGCFGLGLLFMIQRDYELARTYFKRVDDSHPLTAKVDEALSFITRIKEIARNGLTNDSSEAIQLRKDFGKFYSSIIFENIRLMLEGKIA